MTSYAANSSIKHSHAHHAVKPTVVLNDGKIMDGETVTVVRKMFTTLTITNAFTTAMAAVELSHSCE